MLRLSIRRSASAEAAGPSGSWHRVAANALRRAAHLMREVGTTSRGSLQRAATRLGGSPASSTGDKSIPLVIARAADRHEERVRACQQGASQRIDAALCELDRLRQELSAVIDPALLGHADRNGTVGIRAPERPQSAPTVTAGPATRARSAG
jgi:hypothetical protein